MTLTLLLSMLFFQKQENNPIEERFRVDYVLLDVAVVSKSGEPVKDLTQADFEVTEDKKSVPITFFDVLDYDVPKAPIVITEAGATLSKDEAPPAKLVQQIIIALDFESVPVRELNKVFGMLNQFLDGLDPQVSYKLNLYALDRGSLTKGFTNQVDDVKSALANYQDRFIENRYKRSSFDTDLPGLGTSSSSTRVGGFQGRQNRYGGSNLNNDWADFSDLEEALADCAKFPGSRGQACQCMGDTVADYIEQHRYRSERVIGELEILAYKFEQGNDLKSMLVISPGFVLRRLTAATDLLDGYMRAAGCGNGRSSYFAGDIGLESNFDRVAHACIKNRVVFNTFDVFNGSKTEARAFGVEHRDSPSQGVTSAYRRYGLEVVEGLRELAEQSGGTFRQVFKLEGALDKSIRESRFFYTIGYKSPAGTAGKFRNIQVKVKRKGVDVRYRKGYIGS